MKKTILITWWTWYIWSHGVVAFEQAWYKTVIVDNLSNSTRKSLDWIEKILGYIPDFFEVDINDKKSLEKIFQKYKFDWVLHFAGLKAVWESCQKANFYFENNISWSLNLFNLMEKFDVKKIIFSSSATVYKQKKENSAYIETDQTGDCTNPYWTSKYLLENILSDLSKFAWFNVINLRYFNPIWAHSSGYIWENPNGLPNNLLPYIMKVVSWELSELWIFWDDYNTIDWTWVRDYIDVVDLIEWHLLAYEFLDQNSSKNWFLEFFNLWTGNWVSVMQMLNTVSCIIWRKLNYKTLPRREGDLAEVYCDSTKAFENLNWKAKTSLEESVKNSINFINKN